MKVLDAMRQIEHVDNEVKNLQKFCLLSPEARERIADEVGLNSNLETLVNVSVNAMLSWKTTLKEKIHNAELN